MKTLILLITAITYASDKPVTIEAHPSCKTKADIIYQIERGIVCVPSNSAFRDKIFKGGFE